MDESVLLPFQLETVDFGSINPYFIMGLAPGLGKTLCAISIVERLKKKFNKRIYVLYICPASVKLNIKNEILKWTPDVMISCFMNKKDLYPLWDTDYAIINFEMLSECAFLFEWADIVIVDEAHLGKNVEAKRTNYLHEFIYSYEIRRLMLLTGTPMDNQVHDFYSLITMCFYNPRLKDPNFLKKYPTFIDFADHFCHKKIIKNNYGHKIKYEGVKNESELKQYLKNIFITFDPDKVLKIPEGVDRFVPISESQNPKLLEDFNNFLNSDLGQTISSKAKKAAALASVKFTIDYCNLLFNTGVDKIVVYSDHPDAANAIAEGFNCKAMTSDTPMEERALMVKNFQEDPEVKIIVGSPVIQVSWTLTASHHMVVNDYPWRPGELDQLLRRIRRVCQKRTPNYHYILGSYQSQYILELIKKKLKSINKVLEGVRR